MLNDKHTTVLMEEGYMRIHIEYTNAKSRSLICDTIGEVEKEFDVTPEVLHRRIDTDGGTFSIEFSGDDYTSTRTCGEFIERLLKKLDIPKCDYL
ncbi:MAG TPA: hypothetical protein EYG90_06415 [Campylobacterales bacterium]|nr:hypothetical protein [Campylobacterales bacterium]